MSLSDRLSGHVTNDARNHLVEPYLPGINGADSKSSTSSPLTGRRPLAQPAGAPSDRGSATGSSPEGSPVAKDGRGVGQEGQSVRTSGRVEHELAPHHLSQPAPASTTHADGGGHRKVRHGRRQLVELGEQLSERDLAVLRTVAALHFVTPIQLERLHFHEAHATPLAATRACRRSLARLHDLRLLDRLDRRIGGTRAGSASFVYALSRVGNRLLGDSDRRRSREPSFAHLAHVLAVAELVAQLHEHGRSTAVELLAVETEPTCWRSFLDAQQRRRLLKPDLRVTLGVGTHELHWFVEVDRATEHRPALARKITAYVDAWRDGGEQVRAGVFPRALWVVPDLHRATVIASVWESVDTVPEGMFLAATTDQAVPVLTSLPAGGRA